MGRAVHTPELRHMIDKGHLYVVIIGSHSDKTFFQRARRQSPPKDAEKL
jgi:hypothetical protein